MWDCKLHTTFIRRETSCANYLAQHIACLYIDAVCNRNPVKARCLYTRAREEVVLGQGTRDARVPLTLEIWRVRSSRSLPLDHKYKHRLTRYVKVARCANMSIRTLLIWG